LCIAQNHSWSPESFVVCLSISSGGNLLYIPVERETLFRVSLATSTNISLNSPGASVIVAGLLDLLIGDDYETFDTWKRTKAGTPTHLHALGGPIDR
jgi:hypothetical protein